MNRLWEYKKIGDVCVVERGGSPRPIDNFITDNEDGINWIKIGDTSDSMYITESAQRIIPEGMKKSRYVKPGDFLLSNSMSFGRPYILKIDGCIHDGWLVLRDEKELFDKRFLYYYLSSKTTYEKFKSMAVGGVVNNLNSEMVRSISVPVPDKEEQSEIADLLDRIKAVLDRRKQELRLLDTLIKARFVEMFGDPISEKLYKIKTIGEIGEVFTGTTPSTKKKDYYENKDILFIKPGDISENKVCIVDKAENYISDKARKVARIFPKGSVLVTCIGIIGKIGIAEYESSCNQQINVIVPSPTVNSTYLAYNLLLVRSNLQNAANAPVVPILNKTDFSKVEVMVPPYERQCEFATFVEQVDKSKYV